METENGTGTGKVTVYPVFSEIELYYNDMHMAYCNKAHTDSHTFYKDGQSFRHDGEE